MDLQSARFRGDPDLEAAFDNNPPISWGGPREAVKKLQLAFQDLGFLLPRSIDPDTGEADGIFGLETYRVVRGFQLQQGIVRDGIVGRQTMGELDGLFSGQTPPGSRPAGPDQPGAPLTVAERDVTPKKFGTCGGFLWTIDWETNARNGYLVQEITKEFEISSCGGIAPEPAFTGHYFEAWRVQADGGIHGSSGPDDNWINPSLDIDDRLGGFPGTSGRWKTEGKVFFVPQLDPGAGFKLFNVLDAQGLWSTTERPGNLGKALLVRQAEDKWSCCDTETPK